MHSWTSYFPCVKEGNVNVYFCAYMYLIARHSHSNFYIHVYCMFNSLKYPPAHAGHACWLICANKIRLTYYSYPFFSSLGWPLSCFGPNFIAIPRIGALWLLKWQITVLSTMKLWWKVTVQNTWQHSTHCLKKNNCCNNNTESTYLSFLPLSIRAIRVRFSHFTTIQ